MRKDHHVFMGVFLCALLIFTVYVLLDTFVIERRLDTAAKPQTVNAQLGKAEELEKTRAALQSTETELLRE